MQTFLPYAGFADTAACLDWQRLGKQRSETLQILFALLEVPRLDGTTGTGWRAHSAVKMWRGYEYCLATYGVAICEEWRRRGFQDGTLPKFEALLTGTAVPELARTETGLRISRFMSNPLKDTGTPSFVGTHGFHRSHRSNLIRKDPTYYGPLWPDVPDDLPYLWPWRPNDD